MIKIKIRIDWLDVFSFPIPEVLGLLFLEREIPPP